VGNNAKITYVFHALFVSILSGRDHKGRAIRCNPRKKAWDFHCYPSRARI
jgi:hypothetical protein